MRYGFLTCIILLLTITLQTQAIEKEQLKADALAITDLIKKSSELDLYSYQIKAGISKYKVKFSKYSNEDMVYISKICIAFIDLELAVWDGFIEFYSKENSRGSYIPTNDPKVKRHLNELRSFGLKLQMEKEINGAVVAVQQIKSSMPESQFREMLFMMRRMMWSDYIGTYNAIFQ